MKIENKTYFRNQGSRNQGFWNQGFWNRRWLWFVLLLAMGIVLSYLQPITLAEGGEVTFLSMLAIVLIGYFYGGWTGILGALLFAVIKYFLDYHLTLNVAELTDYIFGYGLLGVGGFFGNRQGRHQSQNAQESGSVEKNGFVEEGSSTLLRCYLLAVTLRYIESVWNCLQYYYKPWESLWENIWDESIVYCAGYVGAEVLITVVILLIPQVRDALEYLKFVATHDYVEDLDTF